MLLLALDTIAQQPLLRFTHKRHNFVANFLDIEFGNVCALCLYVMLTMVAVRHTFSMEGTVRDTISGRVQTNMM